MVEAALYREGSHHLIVQPRVLAKTEIVQRFIVEGGMAQEFARADAEEQQDTLSDYEEQNLRFWTAVLRDYSFADVTVDVPAPGKDAVLYVRVRNSGFGDWALTFNGYLYRRTPTIGCYLQARKDQPQAVRIFDEVHANLEEFRDTDLGQDLETWNNPQGRPRIGYWRQVSLSFLADGEGSAEFREAVTWMRERLDRLVSGLHPVVQSMLGKER